MPCVSGTRHEIDLEGVTIGPVERVQMFNTTASLVV